MAKLGGNKVESKERLFYEIDFEAFKQCRRKNKPMAIKENNWIKDTKELEGIMAVLSTRVGFSRLDMLGMNYIEFHALCDEVGSWK